MAINDLYSKRQKRLRGDVPDVYVYDDIPEALRVQLVQIIAEGIGAETQDFYGRLRDPAQLYKTIHETLCREYGVFSLSKERHFSDWEALAEFILQAQDVERVFDVVELSLHVIDVDLRLYSHDYAGQRGEPDDIIEEANCRFKEHGVGMEFVSGEIIRIDSQLLHREVVKPVLVLLSDPRYQGANEEFLKAHEHYRHGRNKECLAECLKAFESTMKIICDSKGWQYNPNDTAKTLIGICIQNGLVQDFMQNHVGNLRTILESGVPTVRNKLGGHGQGVTITTVSESTARFALHTTATNILLFIESA